MHFVIAGCITCPQFTFAVMVAQRLKEHLPDFTYLKISKKPEEWNRWLVCICRKHEWHHIKSPLIWREIGLKQGKKDFIGDINTFLDLCSDYYGVPRDMLSAERFNRGEMNWFTNRNESEFFEDMKSEAKKRTEYRSRQVCITGASSPVAEIIIMELLQIDLQKRENGLEIRLFDTPRNMPNLKSKAMDGKHCPGPSGFGNCRVATNLKEAFLNVDLVIVLDTFAREAKESLVKWLKRNRNVMCALGKALNMYAPPHCRVIIGSPSNQPICYNATVLASFATNLHVRNIIAVTQDLGRETLNFLSKKTGAPLKDFYCPPVWGFIGLNQYIDIRRTLQTFLYKIPGKRPNSTLPQGTEEYELRTSECLINEKDNDEVLRMVRKHKSETFSNMGRWPYLAKATAIVDLLKVWGLKQEDGNGEILCLGVYSDGAFGIPRGIYWSQPVILSNGFWVPFRDFPIPRSPHFDVHYLFLCSIASIYRTKVKPRIYIPPKKVEKPKEKKKFDFEKLAEKVGIPVIRNDEECVMFLKYLCKKELGLDLDEVTDTIIEDDEEEEEISPIEEVVPEPIFCECWRQELKELQKLVFEPSSTTEVEVDLSENISGSEWSVINLNSNQYSNLNSNQYSNLNSNQHSNLDANVNSSSASRVSYSTDLNKSVIMNVPGDRISESTTTLSSSATTVCSCQASVTGSVCLCLGPPKVEKVEKVEEKTSELQMGEASTEHFYREQNAEIFMEDLSNVIYADSYSKEKHVSFDREAKEDDETGNKLKFYGRKDAVRDKMAELKMRERILKYEQGGEESVEEEEEQEGEQVLEKAHEITQDILGERVSFETLGEKTSLEGIEESYGDSMSFKNYSSEPPETEKSMSFGQGLFYGEAFGSLESFPAGADLPGENSVAQLSSQQTLEEDLYAAWDTEEGYGSFAPSEIPGEFEGKKSRKREGVALCCLCRCLVPEGLPCCPCGTTTVVEVFKKESVEILIQCEDDIEYTMEYFESHLPRETEDFPREISASGGDGDGETEETLQKGGELPPESFFPFFPKPINKFKAAERPYEMTKEYIDSFKKTEKEIPSKCTELLEEARLKLEEMNIDEEEEVEEEEEEEDEKELNAEDKENLPPVCELEEHIKTDFSDLNLFIPCGLEDWRLTVQKKYREWFFKGPNVNNDLYYDVAVEEVSEDEFEVDKQLEQYFEN